MNHDQPVNFAMLRLDWVVHHFLRFNEKWAVRITKSHDTNMRTWPFMLKLDWVVQIIQIHDTTLKT